MFCRGLLQVDNSHYIISSHVQRGHRRRNVWENVFHLVLVSFHMMISEINCVMYQDYILRSFKPLYFRAKSLIFLGLHTVRFSRCKPCGYVYVFCACVRKEERRRQQYLFTRPQKTINFCD